MRKYLAVCTILLIAAGAVAQERVAQRASTARRAQPAGTLEVMGRVIPDVSFTDTPLDQVMAWLQEITGLNIQPRWQILDDAGIKRDKTITVQAHNLRLMQVLWLIMNEAGGTDLKLAYRASGNLLVFSTADDLNKEMITKVYDVADLLIQVPQATRQSMFNVTQGMGQGGSSFGGGGGSGGGMFNQGQQNSGDQSSGRYGDQNGQGNQASMQRLVDLIMQTVEPDTWRDNGGNGTIYPFQNLIIVRNTILVHQRLGGYVTEEEAMGTR